MSRRPCTTVMSIRNLQHVHGFGIVGDYITFRYKAKHAKNATDAVWAARAASKILSVMTAYAAREAVNLEFKLGLQGNTP